MVTSRILFTAKQKDELGSAGRTDKVCRYLPGAGKEEQDRRPADRGSQWRDRSGAALQSCGGIEAEEREEISRGIAAGRSVKSDRRGLQRSPSTISREI